MENVELYAKYHSLQREDDIDVLKEFGARLSWSPEGECVLDVGCGPGDVTADILLPLLPPSASLIGVDICPKMVDYAIKKYSNARLKFCVFDFSSKTMTGAIMKKTFSKIFSFFCLQFIQDQKQVAKNIFSLLRPGGEFLIVTVPTNKVFRMYKILSGMEKWKCYMEDIDDIMPRFHFSTSPCDDIEHLLTSEGLEVITCEERNETLSFPNVRDFLGTYEAVNPFIKRMNRSTKDQFMNDYIKVMKSNNVMNETSTEILVQHQFIVVYGKCPNIDLNKNEILN